MAAASSLARAAACRSSRCRPRDRRAWGGGSSCGRGGNVCRLRSRMARRRSGCTKRSRPSHSRLVRNQRPCNSGRKHRSARNIPHGSNRRACRHSFRTCICTGRRRCRVGRHIRATRVHSGHIVNGLRACGRLGLRAHADRAGDEIGRSGSCRKTDRSPAGRESSHAAGRCIRRPTSTPARAGQARPAVSGIAKRISTVRRTPYCEASASERPKLSPDWQSLPIRQGRSAVVAEC